MSETKDTPLSPKEFGTSFQQFLRQMSAHAVSEEPVFLKKLREHFGTEPMSLPIFRENFPEHDHPNLQCALDFYLAAPGRSAQVLGIISEHAFLGVSMSALLTVSRHSPAASEGPVKYTNVTLDGGRVLPCAQLGLFLVREGEDRLALLVQGPMLERHFSGVVIEVMGRREHAEGFLAELRNTMRRESVYRGRVLSLGQDRMGTVKVAFHALPTISRESIILPEGLLDRIERHTLHFSRHREKLLQQGRHLKRGVLLHGPPGTGKTLTAMYIARALEGRTVLLLTGRGFGLLETSCSLARALQPSIVILEDVDLVAEERTRREPGCATPLLFELLNQMDGLADDADVLFLLTTNRPDLLEPALAARPGRVDQAFEIPLPDAVCRRRLFDLYGRGLGMRLNSLDSFVARTERASPAFIRELLRKAALFAADEGDDSVVEDRHLDEAIRELLVVGGELTKSLLGYGRGS